MRFIQITVKWTDIAPLRKTVIKLLKFTRFALHRQSENGFSCAHCLSQHIGAVLGHEDNICPAKKGEIGVRTFAKISPDIIVIGIK
jgi:hypothetical protein